MRTLPRSPAADLSPFALWWAFPIADDDGDSVTLGLAPRRPSRVPVMLNVSSATEVPHASPCIASLAIACQAESTTRER